MSAERAPVFDADVHCAVPSFEALFPYLSEHWKAHLRENMLGGGDSGSGRVAAMFIQFTYPSWSPLLATPGTELTLERLQRDALDGVDSAILNCYFGVESFQHPYFAAALATAVNRWLQDEWLDRDERLLASAVITPQHTAHAVEEIERIADDRRFVQLLLPARSWEPFGGQRYWPIWEAAAEHGLALGITYGGGSGTPPTPVNWMSSFFEHYVTAPVQFHSHITSLTLSGIFERFPSLKVAVLESGWTWLPALLWRMDAEWKAARREVPWVKELPSAYVRRHFRFTTAPLDGPGDPERLRHVLDQLDSDELLMFSSDYPHRYGSGMDELLELLMPDQAERVLWSNARDCYAGRLAARVA